MESRTLKKVGLNIMKLSLKIIILSFSLILLYLSWMALITLLQWLYRLMNCKIGIFGWLIGKELRPRKLLSGYLRFMMSLDLWVLELKMSLTKKLYFTSWQRKCTEEISTHLLRVLNGQRSRWMAVNAHLTRNLYASGR